MAAAPFAVWIRGRGSAYFFLKWSKRSMWTGSAAHLLQPGTGVSPEFKQFPYLSANSLGFRSLA